MELTLFFLTILWSLKTSSSIRCNQCDPEKSYWRTIPICDHFNSADEAYIVDCPKSTMCVKKVTTLDIGNGLITSSVERGCASQTTKEYTMVDRQWQSVDIVHEPYEEGCKEVPNNGERATSALLCYCRGDLCNAAENLPIAVWTLLLPLVIMLLVRQKLMF